MIDLKFPCSQRPIDMEKSDCGYFCSQCDKVIHDFRGKTLQQITEIKDQAEGEVCGVFDQAMIRSKMDRGFSLFRAAFVLVFLMGMSSNMFAQTDSLDAVEPPVEQQYGKAILKGTVTSKETGEVIPFARVYIEVDGVARIGAMTDFDGNYQIELPDEFQTKTVNLKAQTIGYNTYEVINIPVEPKVKSIDFQLENANLDFVGLIYEEHPRLNSTDPWDFNKTVIKGDDLRNY